MRFGARGGRIRVNPIPAAWATKRESVSGKVNRIDQQRLENVPTDLTETSRVPLRIVFLYSFSNYYTTTDPFLIIRHNGTTYTYT